MDTIAKIYVAFSLITLAGMLVGFWFISKKAPKGVLLAVGIGLWLIGQVTGSTPYREARLLSGLCSISGLMGGLLGLMDVLRKEKKTPPTAEPPVLPPEAKA